MTLNFPANTPRLAQHSQIRYQVTVVVSARVAKVSIRSTGRSTWVLNLSTIVSTIVQ